MSKWYKGWRHAPNAWGLDLVYLESVVEAMSVVRKPWAPCPECNGYKEIEPQGADGLIEKCPTCNGTGLAEFCAHVWMASTSLRRLPNYCVKCHTLFEDRHE